MTETTFMFKQRGKGLKGKKNQSESNTKRIGEKEKKIIQIYHIYILYNNRKKYSQLHSVAVLFINYSLLAIHKFT